MFRLFIHSFLLIHLFALYRLSNPYTISLSSSNCKRLQCSYLRLLPCKAHLGPSRSRYFALSQFSFSQTQRDLSGYEGLHYPLNASHITCLSLHLRRRTCEDAPAPAPSPSIFSAVLSCMLSSFPFLCLGCSGIFCRESINYLVRLSISDH